VSAVVIIGLWIEKLSGRLIDHIVLLYVCFMILSSLVLIILLTLCHYVCLI